MESRFTHTDLERLRAALAGLMWLQECIIRSVVWSEPEMGLVIQLSYIWTDEGRICFEAGAQPRVLTLDFSLVDRLVMHNAINSAMLAHPERLDWGVSEIARVDVPEVTGTGDFALMHFLWEGDRAIDVVFRELRVLLVDELGHPAD